MTFTATDVLRLEVEADPAPGQLVNLVQNPSGELGGYGWKTPIAGSVLAGFFDIVAQRWVLRYIGSKDAGGSYFRTEPLPMAAGEWVAARWHYMESGSDAYRVRLTFSNASLTTISSGPYFTYNSPTDDVDANLAPVQAPAGTAFVHLAFEVGDPGGVYPIAIQQAHLRITDVTVAKAATSAELVTTRTNLMTNPSFETNSTGWSAGFGTFSRVTTDHFVGSACGSMAAGGGSLKYTLGTSVAVGMTVTASAYVKASAGQSVIITVDGTNGVITASGGWDRVHVTRTLTSTTSEVRFQVGNNSVPFLVDAVMLETASTLGSYFDGATTDAGGWDYSWNGTANASTSKAAFNNLGFVEPVPYLNILGNLREISTAREELNVGTLSAVVTNPALDPSVADTIRPGRRYRLMASDPADPGSYAPLIVGKLSNAKVEYRPLNEDPNQSALITLTGVDNIAPLANAKRSSTVGRVVDLPYVLEGAGVPWRCDGQSDQVASAEVVVVNDNASALDQVAITRDTAGGYAWVDRQGVLQAVSSFPDPTANHIVNGSFTGSVTFVNDGTANGWVVNSALASRTTAAPPAPSPDGGNAARMVPVGGNPIFRLAAQSDTPYTIPLPLTFYDYIPVNPGGTYRARGYLRSNVSRVAELRVTGVAEGSTTPVQEWIVPYTATPTSSWGLWEIEFIVPVGISRVLLEFTWAVNAAWSSNLPNTDIHWADGVSLTAVSPSPYVLDETVYNPNLTVDYDTDRCINSVAVHRQWTHATEGPQETVYGPYTDAASIAEWGLHHSDITVAGTAPASIPAFASAVLAKNATPEVRVQSLQIHITEATLEYAFIDLYDLVQVVNASLGIDTIMRATAIRHQIVANPDRAQGDRWLMTLEFASEGGVATPTQAPPLGTQAAAGVPMLDMKKNGSTYSLADATESLITGWTIGTNVNMGTVSGSSVVIEVPGTYLVSFTATFPAGASGRRVVDIRKTNATGPILVRGGEVTTATTVAIQASLPVHLDAGEVICGTVYKTGGGSMTLGGTDYLHHFTAYWIGD